MSYTVEYTTNIRPTNLPDGAVVTRTPGFPEVFDNGISRQVTVGRRSLKVRDTAGDREILVGLSDSKLQREIGEAFIAAADEQEGKTPATVSVSSGLGLPFEFSNNRGRNISVRKGGDLLEFTVKGEGWGPEVFFTLSREQFKTLSERTSR